MARRRDWWNVPKRQRRDEWNEYTDTYGSSGPAIPPNSAFHRWLSSYAEDDSGEWITEIHSGGRIVRRRRGTRSY